MKASTVRRLVITVCVAGIGGMIAGSVADNNGIALTAGIVTAIAVLCLMVATAVTGGATVSCMGAVAAAAREGGARTVGVIPRSMDTGELPDHDNDELIFTPDMRTRKAEMDRRSDAFLVLPGGLGTLDELFEALTLVQTQKVTSFPLVLLGTDYWQGMIDWLRDRALVHGTINQSDIDMLNLTDDVDHAIELMVQGRERRRTMPEAPG
jgi:uncharacterized protein (TIGR00730 family)